MLLSARRPSQGSALEGSQRSRCSAARRVARGRRTSQFPGHAGHRKLGGPASAAAARRAADRLHLQEKGRGRVSSQKGAEKPRPGGLGTQPRPPVHRTAPAALVARAIQKCPGRPTLLIKLLIRRGDYSGRSSGWCGVRARATSRDLTSAGGSDPARGAHRVRQCREPVRRGQQFPAGFRGKKG